LTLRELHAVHQARLRQLAERRSVFPPLSILSFLLCKCRRGIRRGAIKLVAHRTSAVLILGGACCAQCSAPIFERMIRLLSLA